MGTKMIRAAIAAAICVAATVRTAAYTIVDYWTGAYSSDWSVYTTENANWRYGADNKGSANFPNGTANTKHAVFHPDYIQNYSVNVPGNYAYKGNLAIGVGTEANPLVISATTASNGFSSNQSGMWFALGYPLSSYYPATDAVVKFSGGTYGPWQAGSYIGTSDGAHYGHLILDGQTIGTTLKFGKADANAFIMYSGRLTSTNANVVCNGKRQTVNLIPHDLYRLPLIPVRLGPFPVPEDLTFTFSFPGLAPDQVGLAVDFHRDYGRTTYLGEVFPAEAVVQIELVETDTPPEPEPESGDAP